MRPSWARAQPGGRRYFRNLWHPRGRKNAPAVMDRELAAQFDDLGNRGLIPKTSDPAVRVRLTGRDRRDGALARLWGR